jgi:Tfp pilus assembly PilM family ATPase
MSAARRTFSGSGTALEIAGDCVSAVRLTANGRTASIDAYAVEAIGDRSLVPSLTERNVQNRDEICGALSRVLEKVGRPKQVSLVVPDSIAKVSFVHLEQVPPRRDDLDRVLRFQVRKAVPFAAEDAQVAWVPGAARPQGQEFVVTIAKRTVIEEYEELCTACGAHPATVDLSTFNVANAVLSGTAAPAGDWLLVNVTTGYVSLGVLRGADLLFFRSRPLEDDAAVADLVHQTAMYYEDRLQGRGLASVVFAAPRAASRERAAGLTDLQERIEAQFSGAAEFLDARAAAMSGQFETWPIGADAVLPGVGLLLRERTAA